MYFIFFLAFLLIVSFSFNGKAEASETDENNDVISIEEFDSLQEEGVIDPNLSYEEFVGSIDSNLGTPEEVEKRHFLSLSNISYNVSVKYFTLTKS